MKWMYEAIKSDPRLSQCCKLLYKKRIDDDLFLMKVCKDLPSDCVKLIHSGDRDMLNLLCDTPNCYFVNSSLKFEEPPKKNQFCRISARMGDGSDFVFYMKRHYKAIHQYWRNMDLLFINNLSAQLISCLLGNDYTQWIYHYQGESPIRKLVVDKDETLKNGLKRYFSTEGITGNSINEKCHNFLVSLIEKFHHNPEDHKLAVFLEAWRMMSADYRALTPVEFSDENVSERFMDIPQILEKNKSICGRARVENPKFFLEEDTVDEYEKPFILTADGIMFRKPEEDDWEAKLAQRINEHFGTHAKITFEILAK